MEVLSINWLHSQRCLAMQKTVYLIVFITLTIFQIWGLSTGMINFAEQGYRNKLVYCSAVILHYAELSTILILSNGVTKKTLSLLRLWYFTRNGFCAVKSLGIHLYLMTHDQNLETKVSVLSPLNVYFKFTWWLLVVFDMMCLPAHIAELDPSKDEKIWTIFQRVKFSRLIFAHCAIYLLPLATYSFTDVYQLVFALLQDSPSRDPFLVFIYALKTIHGFSIFPFLVILYKGVKQKNLSKVITFYKFHLAFVYIVGLLGMLRYQLERQYSQIPETFRILLIYNFLNYGMFSMLLIELIIQIKHPHPEWFDLQINASTKNKLCKKFMKDNKEFFKPCKISPRDLKLLDNVAIGEGQSSYVYKGLIFPPLHFWNRFSPRCLIQRKPAAVVAVKVLKSVGDAGYGEALLKEVQILQKIGHHDHLVRFYGCSVSTINKEWSAVCLIMEYCELGNLQDYLRTLYSRDDGAISANQGHNVRKELLRIAFETSDGMSFLSQNKIVHADLASRNILLDAKKRVKITDFGMSITLYYYQIYASSAAMIFPWRWMAPESLTDLKFSSKSDVWSFGVVLWEIFSLGQVPYEMLEWDSHFVQQIINGCRLQKPNLAGNEIFAIMLHCWELDPYRRPDSAELSLRLCYFRENMQRFE